VTDEQLAEAIEAIEEMLARKAGDRATLIAEVVRSLPAPARPTKAS
jgi:hypothetical protein